LARVTVARARGAGVAFGKAVLGSYSQVILASNAYAGALLLLGSLYDPVVGMAGLDRGGRLDFDNQPRRFVAFDHKGSSESVLRMVMLCLPRVPLEATGYLRWDDVLPGRLFLSRRVFDWLLDVAAPLLRPEGFHVKYEIAREPDAATIRGSGRIRGLQVATTARLVCGRGPVSLEVSVGGAHQVAALVELSNAGRPNLASHAV